MYYVGVQMRLWKYGRGNEQEFAMWKNEILWMPLFRYKRKRKAWNA